jgi:hypothetical protein
MAWTRKRLLFRQMVVVFCTQGPSLLKVVADASLV